MSGTDRPGATERLGGDTRSVARGAEVLARGGLVAFPTETVYGLGADAQNADAVAALYAAKERPRFNPLIAHLPDAGSATRQGRFNEDAAALALAFWPGPLTLVVPIGAACTVSELARAGLDSVALRVPAHPLALDLLRAVGRPIVAPSANRSGRVSPTEAAHVFADLDGRIGALLDGGPTTIGVESTIVACLDGGPRLLRPGGVPREALEEALGHRVPKMEQTGSQPLAPGALASHYAPRARVRLAASEVRPGEAGLLFGPALPGSDSAFAVLNLSSSGDLAEAAANLFGYLRRLDATGAVSIAVAPVPTLGLGEAINDRLARAAAER